MFTAEQVMSNLHLQGLNWLPKLSDHLNALGCHILLSYHALLQDLSQLLGAFICLSSHLPKGALQSDCCHDNVWNLPSVTLTYCWARVKEFVCAMHGMFGVVQWGACRVGLTRWLTCLKGLSA